MTVPWNIHSLSSSVLALENNQVYIYVAMLTTVIIVRFLRFNMQSLVFIGGVRVVCCGTHIVLGVYIKLYIGDSLSIIL